MFTTGSKLYFGAAVVAFAGAIVYGIGSGWEIAGVMMLFSMSLAVAFLGGVVVAFRDNTLSVAAEATAGADASASATHGAAPANSPWPILAAGTAALTAVGAALDKSLFYVGIALLVGVALEWIIQGWADRASADRAYNNAVRGRLVHPLEFPILGALVVGFVIFTFSRLMLALDESAAIVAFVLIGSAVLVAAVLLGRPARMSRNVLGVTLATGIAVLLAVGIVGLVRGARTVTLETEKTSNAVGDKSNTAATIRFDGGSLNVAQIVLPKANPSGLLFRQGTPGKHRLVIESIAPQKQSDGSFTDKPATYQTDLIGEGKTAYLFVRLVRSGTFTFTIQDEAGAAAATGKVVVP